MRAALIALLAAPCLGARVAVIAQGRSGSSFLSSYFGANAATLYFLEPCSNVYVKGGHADAVGAACMKHVDRVFNCDLSGFNLVEDQSSRIPPIAVGFKGWGNQSDAGQCASAAHVVVKELRVGQAWAQHAVEFDPAVRIVVLLRDPRAVVSSRKLGWPAPTKRNDTMANPPGWNGHSGFPYDQSLRSLCMEHKSLRERALETPQTVLLIEYEEVLRDPMAVAQRVFKHIGLDAVPAEVAAHVEKNTKGDCAHVDAPFSVCRKLRENAVDDKWKSKIDAAALKDLLKLDVCRDVVARYDDAAAAAAAATAAAAQVGGDGMARADL